MSPISDSGISAGINPDVAHAQEQGSALAGHAGRVAVLMGGESAEREVSLRSGNAVLNALRAQGIDAHGVDWRASRLPELLLDRPDRVFITLHGRGGEDGVLQGALQLAGIPYTGSGVLGCALSMDKIRAKQIWRAAGLPTPDFLIVDTRMDPTSVVARLGLPLMVKPAREGSSIGISLVTRAEELPAAVALAREFDPQVLLESYIRGGEYTVALVDDEVLPAIKLETPRAFYDYEAKYHSDTTRYLCPAGLSAEEEAALGMLARQAFTALDAAGWGRVDFMLDETGQPWLIELNAVPGMTDHSLVPMAAAQAGWSFEQLVQRILVSSFGSRA